MEFFSSYLQKEILYFIPNEICTSGEKQNLFRKPYFYRKSFSLFLFRWSEKKSGLVFPNFPPFSIELLFLISIKLNKLFQ